MRTRQTLTISLPPEMLKQVEKTSRAESRTQSELIREALRRYFSGFPVIAASPAELKAIAKGRSEFQRGRYVTLDALLDDVANRRRKPGVQGARKASFKGPRAR